MSKKLIAVASAAALALSALVAVPASGAAGDYAVNGETNAATTLGLTAATAFTVNVPEDNEFAGADSDSLEIVVTPVSSGATISATANGSVKILTADEKAEDDPASTTATGKGTFSEKAVLTGAVTFYVYTTSTTAGALTIKNGDNSATIYVKGVAGTPNSVTAKFPTALNSTTASDIDVTVKDAFGNDVVGTAATDEFAATVSGSTLTTDVVGAAAVSNDGKYTWSTTRKVWVGKVIGVAGGGQASMTVTLDNGGFDGSDSDLAAASLVAFSSVSSADLATQVKNLTAQVAALTAQLAATVTKKKYNKLARKWNRANPSNKVKLSK